VNAHNFLDGQSSNVGAPAVASGATSVRVGVIDRRSTGEVERRIAADEIVSRRTMEPKNSRSKGTPFGRTYFAECRHSFEDQLKVFV
jgi:hypothetical protein